MAVERIPRIGLPGGYYDQFGIRTIPNQTNDPGYPGVTPPKTMNPLSPGLRMYPPVNDASTGRVRVADNSPEQVYQQIYGEPLGYSEQAPSFVSPGGGRVTGYQDDPLFGQATPSPKVNRLRPSLPVAPNQPSGTVVAGKDQSRLTPNVFGYGTNGPTGNAATAAIDGATAKTGLQQVPYGVYMNNRSRDSVEYARQGRSDLFKMLERQQQQQGDGILDLTRLTGMSDQGAQGIADSEGKPIRAANGKVYYPGGKAPQPASGMPTTGKEPGPLGKLMGLKQGGLSGLLSGMIGGFNMSNGGRAGASTVPGLGALLGGMGGSSFGFSPSQGQAMIVQPGTSTGSVLSGMGFSDGAAVPAATIRNLEQRGYF